VIGADPHLVDEIAAKTLATVVVEADGSRGKPFKAPDTHEPVIPLSASLVVVVVGADAIGQPIGAICHRPERVTALTGAELHDLVSVDHIVAVASHPVGGRKNVPEGARLALAITKVGPGQAAAVEMIRDELPEDIELAVVARH
jgi:molybdenum cofactor cytidylyltransferase